jgi:pilus assembly protein CpaB
MKPKTLILMVVAITCGLGASYMTSRLLAERQTNTDVKTVDVLVAKKALDTGLSVKNVEDNFEFKKYPEGEEPKNAIVVADQLKNRILKHALRVGDFVTPEDLVDFDQQKMSYILPAGHQAYGIRVTMESIAGGFASLPHSRVNIISTVRRGDDKSSYAQVLLENVLVLAADQQTGTGEQKAMPASVVTVALKPEEVLKVSLAKELGPLTLALRKYNDQSRSDINKLTVENIMTNTQGTDEVETASAPPVKINLPPIAPKVEVAKVVEPVVEVTPAIPEPQRTLVKLRIIQGEQEHVQTYLLDDSGKVVTEEIRRTDAPAPPRPPQPQAVTHTAPAAAPVAPSSSRD